MPTGSLRAPADWLPGNRRSVVFDSLNQLITGSPVTYLVIAGVIVADAILPLLPSETLVIAAAVLSAQGRLLLPLIILAAGCGAFVGDNANYWIGRSLGVRAVRRLLRGEKGRGRLRWGQEQVEQHGARLIVVARFIPGGRIATTLASGTLEMDWRRFLVADAAGAVLWSSSIALIGYFGGSAFGHSTWKALLLAFGIALVATALVEAGRRLHGRGDGGRRRAHGSA